MVAAEGQPVISDEEILPSNTAVNEDNNNDDIVDYYGSSEKSLIIPITSSATLLPNGTCQFIEIFPEEISSINPSTLSTVLRDERASVKTWCEASLLYMRSSGSGGGNTHHEKEGCELLTLAVDNDDVMNGSNTTDRLRVLASAGIAALAHANRHAGDVGRTSTSGGGGGEGGGGGGAGADIGSLLDDLLESSKSAEKQDAELREELRTLADSRFVKADNINQVNPMTWIGRGMLNLAQNKLDQARFFFENLTLRECGETLPALIGMAAVKFIEKDYSGALDLYSRAIRKYPHESGSVTRVGFGMACYRLGQVDRAKASFRRAHEMDAENVEALVALAVLEMSSLDGDVLAPREYRARAENVLKLLSMANVVDHTNAMVQNHLANHYFWKWTPVPGMVSVEQRSDVVRGNMVSSLEVGDRIRIGHEFETVVIAENNNNDMDENETENLFKIKDRWKIGSASNLKIWKKDYDRVVSLAKGAYNSTNMPEVQAESLYMLARVFHARGDMEQANKFYDKACLLSPELSPARFGLAQTLIWDEAYDEAAAHLRLLLGTCSNATDALAALGLLEVKAGKDRREAFMYLKKAIDLDPFNSDLVLIEALALQQQESDYPLSLDRYRKAVRLLKAQGKKVPADVLTNMGVLCHETKLYDEALDMYNKALKAVEAESNDAVAGGADENGDITLVKHKENDLFWKYIDTDIRVESAAGDDKTSLIVSSSQTITSIGIKVGDNISLDGGIETTIKEVSGGDNGLIHLVVEEEVDLENSKSNLSVKRCNGRLRNPNSISIAFNLARLHESSGRIVPAVELHKAILKQHPAYVNSYLRLACIARDCGSLKDCSEWLKMAVAVAPGNPEVLTLVGNLHLSLCDWAPAQNVFDQLLQQKGKNPLVGFVYQIIGRRCAYPLSVPKVEAYSMLSLGNIYFNNLNTPNKYSKHLQHAADFYRRILQKDSANAYAANGLGTVLAEKGELFKAKEIFNRVREVSGDTLSDSLLNLGHIYLAQKKHPEALQMYQNYLGRTFSSAGVQTTSKSQEDDEAEVLLYIAFAYFDWARQTELFNNAKASPADERYQQCIQYIELAMKKSKRENCVLRYNWCLAKLQGANCVLQKVNRNIRRTAQEVKDALDGLEESLPILQTILQWKEEGRKVAISKGMLSGVVNQCKHNIDSAKSHLKEELKNEQDAERLRHFQRTEAEINEKQRTLAVSLQKEKEAQEIEESELRAKKKMERVNNLLDGWKQAETASKKDPTPKKRKGDAPPGEIEDEAPDTSALFDDSEDEDDKDMAADNSINAEVPSKDKELFGDSSSDEEFLKNDEQANKKRKLENSQI